MGGVAGHTPHLHESMDLTFGEIKSILRDVASANIEAYEKVDGQNIFFSWNAQTKKIQTARNPTDIRTGGMTPEAFAKKWEGHPAESAFMNGFAAIEQAIQKMSEEKLKKIFGENSDRYVNAEIMYAANPNLIQYDGNYIVVHNLQSFTRDDDDKIVQDIVDTGEFDELVKAIDKRDAKVSKEKWKVYGPRVVTLNDISKEGHYERLVAAIDSVKGSLSDDASIGDFVAEKLRTGDVGKLRMPIERQENLITRIVGLVRGEDPKTLPDLTALKKGLDDATQKKMSKMATVANARATVSILTAPLERAISDFAIEVLRGMQSFFVKSHDSEVKNIRSKIAAAIQKLEATQGESAERIGSVLKKQMAKLGEIGNIVQSLEGIVFEYPPGSKKLYKMTGSFAMANQLWGESGLGKGKKSDSDPSSSGKTKNKKSVTEKRIYPPLVTIFFG